MKREELLLRLLSSREPDVWSPTMALGTLTFCLTLSVWVCFSLSLSLSLSFYVLDQQTVYFWACSSVTLTVFLLLHRFVSRLWLQMVLSLLLSILLCLTSCVCHSLCFRLSAHQHSLFLLIYLCVYLSLILYLFFVLSFDFFYLSCGYSIHAFLCLWLKVSLSLYTSLRIRPNSSFLSIPLAMTLCYPVWLFVAFSALYNSLSLSLSLSLWLCYILGIPSMSLIKCIFLFLSLWLCLSLCHLIKPCWRSIECQFQHC